MSKINTDFLTAIQPTFDQLVKQTILRAFDELKTYAHMRSDCQYNPCGCAILDVNIKRQEIAHYTDYNGPCNSQMHIPCIGNKWACNCTHAEIRVLMRYLRHIPINQPRNKAILITTNTPCSICMNVIVDSNVVDILACRRTYDSIHLPVLLKDELEKSIDNKLLKQWLYAK